MKSQQTKLASYPGKKIIIFFFLKKQNTRKINSRRRHDSLDRETQIDRRNTFWSILQGKWHQEAINNHPFFPFYSKQTNKQTIERHQFNIQWTMWEKKRYSHHSGYSISDFHHQFNEGKKIHPKSHSIIVCIYSLHLMENESESCSSKEKKIQMTTHTHTHLNRKITRNSQIWKFSNKDCHHKKSKSISLIELTNKFFLNWKHWNQWWWWW